MQELEKKSENIGRKLVCGSSTVAVIVLRGPWLEEAGGEKG